MMLQERTVNVIRELTESIKTSAGVGWGRVYCFGFVNRQS